MSCSRVRYNITYSGGLYTFPKAPELIKIAHAVAPDVFYDSSSDYEPIAVDLTAIDYDYGQQIFTDVANQKNMVWVSSAISGTCVNSIYKFIKVAFFSSDVPGDNVSGDYVPSGNESITIG